MRCVLATLALATSAAPAAGAVRQPADAGPPSPAEAMRTWHEVDGWIRQWRLPPDAGGFPEAAACVTLRLSGDVIGRGEDYRADDRSVWRAAMRAMEEAAGNVGAVNDAFREDRLRMFAERMTLDVELASPLTPFRPATYAEAEAALSPGTEGVAVRLGEDVRGMFPGTMLGANMLPHQALANRAAAAIGNAAAGLQEPGRLAEQHKLVFYRFGTRHLAQTAPTQPPVFLHRGGRLVLREQVHSAELRRMADAMAAHLARRISAADEGGGSIQEGYRPWLHRYDGEERGQTLLLAGIALDAWEQWGGAGGEAGGEAVRAARAAAVETPIASPVGEGDVLPLAFGAVLIARHVRAEGAAEDADLRRWLREAAAALAALHDETSGFAGQVREHERAPLAWALAEAAAALDEEGAGAGEAAHAAVRRIYRDTPEGSLVQHMPWLGWAELRLADESEGKQVAAAGALRRMREHVWAHQVGPLDVDGGGHDLVGGIVFTASANPLPDWHTLRPIAFLATMLGDERLTDRSERAGQLGRLLSSLRFLRQLEADDSHMWMFRDAEASIGGVRAALWDQRMPADATSLGLLTTVETLRSLEGLSEPR